jgi:hypothetical protein
MEFGSIVYGTNLPTSDKDFKGIFLPDARSLILQRAQKHIQNNTKKDKNARNTSGDVDKELFSVSEYMRLLLEGQTVALDMLFTPQNHIFVESKEWDIIKENKHHFLHKGTTSFVGYTKQQASKYGLKGFRIHAIKAVLDWLVSLPDYTRLKDHNVEEFVSQIKNEYIKIVTCKGPNSLPELHLEVCGKKIPFHATIKYSKQLFQKAFDEYGHRARLAEQNQGVDWKALLHSVRVSREAQELLLTGNITFPRPEASLLLQIRKGELPYKEVAEIIEKGLEDVELAQQQSLLPAGPNLEKAEELIYYFHTETIKDHII